MSISEAMLPEFDQEMANTRKTLERVPEDKFDYKPHEKSMTLGRLAGHIAELPEWAKMTIEMEVLEMDGSYKPYAPKSRKEVLEKFDAGVAEARALLAKASDEDLMKIWTLKGNGQIFVAMPRVACLRGFVINHMIHHRAQLGVYLRLNNVDVPGMYGPSADEPNFMSAAAS